MLTPTATARIDDMADKLGMTRSEVLERLARSECLNVETIKAVGEAEDTDESDRPLAVRGTS